MYIESINFSLWCDFLERSFIDDEFEILIQDNIINGATSNPSIFNSAFLNSQAYKDEIASLGTNEPKAIYEALAFEDIQNAAKKLLPLYKKGDDGFVSIEVDPFLAHDAKATTEEGKRIYKTIGMPNVMIKVPATKEGCEAIEALMGEGINVNATLIFSPSQGEAVLKAMEEGIKKYQKSNLTSTVPKGVISVFVSRFDRKLDSDLAKKGLEVGRVGIMNALKIYNIIQAAQNEHIRTLFASTGVKGDTLDEDYYIKELLYPNSINTAPLQTINAFIAQGKSSARSLVSDEEIDAFFTTLEENGVDMQNVYDELMSEGIVAFENAFDEILTTLKQ